MIPDSTLTMSSLSAADIEIRLDALAALLQQAQAEARLPVAAPSPDGPPPLRDVA